jgi:hypothetical protein
MIDDEINVVFFLQFRAHCGLVMTSVNYWVTNLDELDLGK